jgi:hypothetical protein
LVGAKTVVEIFNCKLRLWGKCTDCEENAQIIFLPQFKTTDCEENAQIVFLPQIETTDCEENA